MQKNISIDTLEKAVLPIQSTLQEIGGIGIAGHLAGLAYAVIQDAVTHSTPESARQRLAHDWSIAFQRHEIVSLARLPKFQLAVNAQAELSLTSFLRDLLSSIDLNCNGKTEQIIRTSLQGPDGMAGGLIDQAFKRQLTRHHISRH